MERSGNSTVEGISNLAEVSRDLDRVVIEDVLQNRKMGFDKRVLEMIAVRREDSPLREFFYESIAPRDGFEVGDGEEVFAEFRKALFVRFHRIYERQKGKRNATEAEAITHAEKKSIRMLKGVFRRDEWLIPETSLVREMADAYRQDFVYFHGPLPGERTYEERHRKINVELALSLIDSTLEADEYEVQRALTRTGGPVAEFYMDEVFRPSFETDPRDEEGKAFDRVRLYLFAEFSRLQRDHSRWSSVTSEGIDQAGDLLRGKIARAFPQQRPESGFVTALADTYRSLLPSERNP